MVWLMQLILISGSKFWLYGGNFKSLFAYINKFFMPNMKLTKVILLSKTGNKAFFLIQNILRFFIVS